jgi:hypothetical protein
MSLFFGCLHLCQLFALVNIVVHVQLTPDVAHRSNQSRDSLLPTTQTHVLLAISFNKHAI